MKTRGTWLLLAALGCGCGNGETATGPREAAQPRPEAAQPRPEAAQAGAGESGQQPVAATPDQATAAPSCDERTAGMERQMMAASGEGVSLLPPTRGSLPRTAGGALVKEVGHVVEVDPAGTIVLHGDELGSPEELRERLRNPRWAREQPLSRAYVMADQGLEAAMLAGVVEALPAGVEARLVVAPDQPVPQPPARLLAVDSVKKLHAELTAPDASMRATMIAKALQGAIPPCAPVVRAFGDVAGLGPENKLEFLARRVPAGLRECRCKVLDVDMVEYAMLAVSGVWEQRLRWVKLPAAAALRATKGSVGALARGLAGR